jgi:branched-chain amino acid transport system substrate-binding protein
MRQSNNARKSFSLKLAVSALILVMAVGCSLFRSSPTGDNQAPKIGANLSLTGPFPYWSQQIKRGLDLALEHADASGSAKKPVIVYEDNQGDPKNGVTAIQKLINVDGVSVVITAHTPIAKAQRPIADQSKVPLLGTVVSAVDFGQENQWSFLDWPSHQVLSPPVGQYSYKGLGARKAATFVINDAYGTDGAKLFTEAFTKEGGQVVAAETMAPTDTDFRGQLTKIVNARPDVLYMVARDAALANAVRQARQAGYQGKIVGVNAFDAPIVWDTLGELGDGIVFSSIQADLNSQAVKQFEADYRKKYSEAPDWVSLYGYSIGQYLIKVVQDAGNDREKIRAALSSLNAETLRGTLVMNSSREINQQASLYLRQNGQNVPVK